MAIKAILRHVGEGFKIIYAYQCSDCKSTWKAYQRPCHFDGCGTLGKPSKKQKAEVLADTRNTLVKKKS